MATNSSTNISSGSSGSSGTVLCTPSKPQSKLNTAQGHMAACVGETIEVTMGMFFDGTGNNKFNTDLGSRGSDDKESSYYNSYSNVARAWQYYKGSLNGVPLNNIQRPTDDEGHNFNIYIEGIGTKKGEKDSTIGFGLGQGAYGISTRVNEGSRKVADILEKEIDLNKVKEIKVTFDVFGFSRGAAAARHFIHINSERKKYYDNRTYNSFLHYWFNIKNYGYNSPKAVNININWRFAGLYETVSSHGGNRSDDVGELGLMNINQVENIFHIVAKDEYREKFSITPIQTPTIKNGKITSKTTRGTGKDSQGNSIDTVRETYVMHGVHSDIGGGYANSLDEIDRQIFNSSNKARVEKVKKEILDQGWYKEKNGNNSDKLLITQGSGQSGRIKKLIASRTHITNIYSYIPLHLMTDKAIAAGVNFDNNITSSYSVASNSFLSSIYSRLKTNPDSLTKKELNTLRYEHLHWSARYGEIAGAHDPIFNDNDSTKFEREIIPI